MVVDLVAQIDRSLPMVVTDEKPTCWRCGRVLAEYLTRPWSLRCRKCHADNKSAP